MSRRRSTPKELHHLRHGNEQLACSICGYRFPAVPWMVLWVIKAHFDIWHGQEEVTLLTCRPNDRLDVPEPITMGEAEDITRLLKQLADMDAAVKQTTVEARQALKDLKHEFSAQQAEIRKMITDEVAAVAAELEGEAQARLRERVDGIAEALRLKLLGLID